MRAVLAIAVGLACPLTAGAQTADDRYGLTSIRLYSVHRGDDAPDARPGAF
jgi:hypothetical protein